MRAASSSSLERIRHSQAVVKRCKAKIMRLEKKVKSLKDARKDENYAYDMQVQHHNTMTAVRRDDLFVSSCQRRESVKGSGFWKVWLPLAMLRIAFHSRMDSQKGLARTYHSSNRTIRRIRCAVASVVLSLQDRGLSDFNARTQGESLKVVNLLWDESRFNLACSGSPVGCWPVMLQHACVSAEGLGDERYVLDEEYIIRPATLRRNGAAEMKEAMRVAQGSDLIKEVENSFLGALLLTADSARPNLMLVAHFMLTLPSNVVVVF